MTFQELLDGRTPGPWERDDEDGHSGITIYSRNGTPVAGLLNTDGPHCEQDVPNAELIVRAVNNIVPLRDALEELLDDYVALSSLEPKDVKMPFILKARAALAKLDETTP